MIDNLKDRREKKNEKGKMEERRKRERTKKGEREKWKRGCNRILKFNKQKK
jgi:hypothetical protein